MSDAKGRYFLIILLGVLFFTPKGWKGSGSRTAPLEAYSAYAIKSRGQRFCQSALWQIVLSVNRVVVIR